MRSTHALVLACLLACERASVAVEQPEAQTIPTPEAEGPGPLHCDGTNAAIVGGEAIPMAEFDAFYSFGRRFFEHDDGFMPKDADSVLHRNFSERLILNKLLELECRRLGIDYDEAALAERVAELKQLRPYFESDESIRQLSIADLRERAVLEAEGTLEVTAEEVAAEYERLRRSTVHDELRIHASEIVIDVDDPSKEAEALALAEELSKRVSAGEDFAQLAREHSDGATAKAGGDLGIFVAGQINEEVGKVAFKLEPGKVSKPIRSTVLTSISFYVILVHDRYPPGELPLAALEPEIVERVLARQLELGRRELAERLPKAYVVENCIAALARSRGLEW